MKVEKIDRSPRGFAARNGISVGTVYIEIREGRLSAKKLRKRTIITQQAEDSWLAALPDMVIDINGRLVASNWFSTSRQIWKLWHTANQGKRYVAWVCLTVQKEVRKGGGYSLLAVSHLTRLSLYQHFGLFVMTTKNHLAWTYGEGRGFIALTLGLLDAPLPIVVFFIVYAKKTHSAVGFSIFVWRRIHNHQRQCVVASITYNNILFLLKAEAVSATISVPLYPCEPRTKLKRRLARMLIFKIVSVLNRVAISSCRVLLTLNFNTTTKRFCRDFRKITAPLYR